MAKLTHVTVVLLGVVGATAACSALIATGCSSSSSPGVGTDSGEDAQDDGGQSPDAKQDDGGKTKDAQDDGKSKADGEVADGSKADVVESDVVETDVLSDVVVADVVVDAPEDVVVTHADAGDAAADAAPTSCTTIAKLDPTDGGVVDSGTPAPVVVTGFDTSSTAGWALSADSFIGIDGGPQPGIAYSATVGDTCPGSIALTVPFTAYGAQQVELTYDYQNNPQGYPSWANHTKLHYSVLVAFDSSDGGTTGAEAGTVDLSSISAIGDYAQWASYHSENDNAGSENYSSWYLQTFTYGTWMPVTLTLSDSSQADGGVPTPTGTTCATGDGCKFSTSLNVPATGVDGGAAAPTTTVLYIDDIWLE